MSAAEAVLRANDRGTFTVPSGEQYPHQWNWDSAIIALGWAMIDVQRAYTELDTLCAAQREDGLIAQIAFSLEPQSYMPGPEWWGEHHGRDGRRISAITQPPLAAVCLRLLFERFPDERRTRALLEPLQRWHDWLLGPRDPDGIGEPVIVHPWETGRDNAVEWDVALGRVPRTTTPFTRLDRAHVDGAQRPTDAFYERCLHLTETFRGMDGDPVRMARESPFRVLDPGFSAITAAACRDLGWLARQLGAGHIADRSDEQAGRIAASLAQRRGGDGLLHAVDMVSGDEISLVGAGEAIAVLAPDQPRRATGAAVAAITGGLHTEWGVASLDPAHPMWDPVLYWRGPVWSIVTWLCAVGLERAGQQSEGNALRTALRVYNDRAPMAEYADSRTGAPLGSPRFSWAAALFLWEAGGL